MDNRHLELLTRIDERQAAMKTVLDDIVPVVKQNQRDIRDAKTHIKVIKWLGGIVTAVGSYVGFSGGSH